MNSSLRESRREPVGSRRGARDGGAADGQAGAGEADLGRIPGRTRDRAEKTGRSVGGDTDRPEGGFHHNPL